MAARVFGVEAGGLAECVHGWRSPSNARTAVGIYSSNVAEIRGNPAGAERLACAGKPTYFSVPVPGSDAPPCGASQHSGHCCWEPRSRTPVPRTIATRFAISIASSAAACLYQAGQGGAGDFATAHLNRANIHARRRKYALAFADYASAIALDPRNPLIPYNRGNAYLDTRRYELAVADYSRAIELDADFALAYLNRGIARERRRRHESAAAEDFGRALAIDPKAGAAKRAKKLKRLQSQ